MWVSLGRLDGSTERKCLGKTRFLGDIQLRIFGIGGMEYAFRIGEDLLRVEEICGLYRWRSAWGFTSERSA